MKNIFLTLIIALFAVNINAKTLIIPYSTTIVSIIEKDDNSKPENPQDKPASNNVKDTIKTGQKGLSTVADANSFNEKGNNYLKGGDFENSLEYFNKALDIRKQLNNKAGMAEVLDNIGFVYYKKQEYDEAFFNWKEALNIYKELNNKDGMVSEYIKIGDDYMKQANYQTAIKYENDGLELAKTNKNKNSIIQAYNALIAIYKAMGNTDLAIEYKDSITQIEKDESLSQMKSSYEKVNEVNQNQIKQMQDSSNILQNKIVETTKENVEQRRYLKFVIGGLAVVLFFLMLVFRQRNRIAKQRNRIKEEKKRSDDLLLNILPREVAEELKSTGTSKAKSFKEVTVMFTDFKGFTQISEKMSPEQLVRELDHCFTAFDKIIHKHGLEKIKTIGDAYMCVGGLPKPKFSHPGDTVSAALEIRDFMDAYNKEKIANDGIPFEIRIGINTGPVVAGIVGLKKFAYDIWGDTVNLASRMESSGKEGEVNISGSTYQLIKFVYKCTYRGKVHTKNKGEVEMYFVDWKDKEKE